MSRTSDIYEEEPVKRSYMMEALILIMLLLLLLVFFWDNLFITIPAGHKGVLFRTLAGGTVTDKYFVVGPVFIFSWNEMYVYDTRIISGQDTIDALTEDGLQVRVEISYRYRPNIDSLGNMHKNLGLDYGDKIIVPHVTAASRNVISRCRIDALYTTSRSDIQNDMLVQVRNQVDSIYPIAKLDLVARSIVLDETVEKAIAEKLVKEQEMLGYDFLIEKELPEEERKLIEARGIKLFRDTSGIDILKWSGIEATKELATSENAKVLIIGTDSGEMPVILRDN